MRGIARLSAATLLLASSAVVAGCDALFGNDQDSVKLELGLMTSLPIYWEESEEFGDLLNAEAEPNWVRLALEKDHVLKPLDSLSVEALAPLYYLLLAQPRALSPQENVALDEWVRDGGRLVLFADPMLTQESRFALGDARAPQPVALLSPILARWGLELTFDERQAEGERIADVFGYETPVNLPGRLRLTQDASEARCELGQDGLYASCVIGAGSAWIIADAAAFDTALQSNETRRSQVASLLECAFSP